MCTCIYKYDLHKHTTHIYTMKYVLHVINCDYDIYNVATQFLNIFNLFQ